MNNRLLKCLAIVVAWLSQHSPAEATVFDATSDFSTKANPNGAWSYGFDPAAESGFQFKLFDRVEYGSHVGDSEFWLESAYGPVTIAGPWAPTIYKDLASPPFAGGAKGQIGLHPGPVPFGDSAILRFTAPASGVYSIQAQFFVGDRSETEAWVVRKDNFSAPVASLGLTSANPAFKSTTELTAGESIDFVVGNYGEYGNDSTPVTIRVEHIEAPASSTIAEWTVAGAIAEVLGYPQGADGLKCFSMLNAPVSVKSTVREDRFGDAVRSIGWLDSTFVETRLGPTFLPSNMIQVDGSSDSPSYVTSDRFRFETLIDPQKPAGVQLAQGVVSDGLFRSEWTDNLGCRYSVVGQETSRRPLQVGDVTGDQLFDSGDLVQIFASGKYETGLPANWSEGDWTFDNRFDTTDLIEAFKTGTYEKPAAGAVAVPEPSSWGLMAFALSCFGFRKRRRLV
jgi:hypothetical protein